MRRPLVLDSLMRRSPLGVSAVVLGLQHTRDERFQTCEGCAYVAIELRLLGEGPVNAFNSKREAFIHGVLALAHRVLGY